MRERDVERHLVKAVAAAGGLALKFTSPGRRNVPDRIVVLNGLTHFVELKRPGERPSAAQVREHDRIGDAGGTVWVVDSVESADKLVELMLR
jgi:Holliday junction resolvase